MFERLSERARQVVVLARDGARSLGNHYIFEMAAKPAVIERELTGREPD